MADEDQPVETQCIAVARAVSSDARILLLDEPLAAMGAREARLIIDLIERLKVVRDYRSAASQGEPALLRSREPSPVRAGISPVILYFQGLACIAKGRRAVIVAALDRVAEGAAGRRRVTANAIFAELPGNRSSASIAGSEIIKFHFRGCYCSPRRLYQGCEFPGTLTRKL